MSISHQYAAAAITFAVLATSADAPGWYGDFMRLMASLCVLFVFMTGRPR